MHSPRVVAGISVVFAATLMAPLTAQPPAPPSIIPPSPQAPTISVPQPLGAQAGTGVELTFTGTNLADPVALHTGFPAKVTFPTDANNTKDQAKLRVKLEVPSDTPVG